MAPVGEVVLAFTISALAFLLGWLANERIRRRKIDSAQVAVKKIISDAEGRCGDPEKDRCPGSQGRMAPRARSFGE